MRGQFEKGHIPHNKGKTFRPPGIEKGFFKKGNIPPRYKPVGTERTDKRDGTIRVKTGEPNIWRYKHHLAWEARNGPLPAGHIVIFGDGDTANLNPNNLVAVTRGELVQLNKRGLIGGNGVLTRVGKAIVQVDMLANKVKGR